MNWRPRCVATFAAISVFGSAAAGEQFTDKSGIANFGYDVALSGQTALRRRAGAFSLGK
jgi:hypothetical protein